MILDPVEILLYGTAAFFLTTIIYPAWVMTRKEKKREEAKPAAAIFYGILEQDVGSGARTWLTPFDIPTIDKALHEAAVCLRDRRIASTTVFVSKNGVMTPLVTITRADSNILEPKTHA